MNVAALISGGVDSSVAVHLLCEQGYRPDLFYIKIGMEDRGYPDCSQEEDWELVTATARRYGLHCEMVDLRTAYWERVVAYVIDRVSRGLTPNPDVMCNRLIKFGCFEERVGYAYDRTATGHYATLVEEDGSTWLGTSPDPVKDQTDFLAQLDKWQVARALFPIGTYTKVEVRRMAEAARLPAAHRRDSQGICFLGKIDYNAFIKRYLGCRSGDIVEWETGRVLGRHQGYWFYTIGQRKGIGLGGGPWFVCRKDVDANVVYVTRNCAFGPQMADELRMNSFHFITSNPWSVDRAPSAATALGCEGISVRFKIRHVSELMAGTLFCRASGEWCLHASEEVCGVAPGQFCVVYSSDGRICYGSGEIGLSR